MSCVFSAFERAAQRAEDELALFLERRLELVELFLERDRA